MAHVAIAVRLGSAVRKEFALAHRERAAAETNASTHSLTPRIVGRVERPVERAKNAPAAFVNALKDEWSAVETASILQITQNTVAYVETLARRASFVLAGSVRVLVRPSR